MSSSAQDARDLAVRLDRIQQLTDQLLIRLIDAADARAVAERIRQDLRTVRSGLYTAQQTAGALKGAGHH